MAEERNYTGDELAETRLYTVQDISAMFNVKELTVYGWIWKGKLDAIKAGQWRITEEQLQDFIQAGRRRKTKRPE